MTQTHTLETAIRATAHDKERPDGSRYRSLAHQDETTLAATFGCTRREVQRTALTAGVVPERYSRNQTSISAAEQLRLLAATVAVVGLGGLGGAVSELLARVGIGRLILIDGDTFEESNLNRQLLSTTSLLGRLKATAAAARIHEINPAVETTVVTEYLTSDNCSSLLLGATMVADCLDSIPDRIVLERGCHTLGLPLVSAAIGGTCGQLLVSIPGGGGLRRIYSQSAERGGRGAESFLGTLGYAAVATAALECAAIVTLILGRPDSLGDKLLLLDCTHLTIDQVELP